MSQAPNKCSQCGKCFTSRANCERHAITHTTEKPYNCSHCGKAFNDWSNCQRHEVGVHKAAKPDGCSSITQQGVHLKRVRAKSHKCQLCSKCFRYPSELEKHALRTHRKKLYRCQHCSKCFRFLSDWKRHLRTHRNNMCQPCKKYFKNAWELKRHNNRNHGAENSFKCKECGKCFSDSSSLQLHEKSHTVLKQSVKQHDKYLIKAKYSQCLDPKTFKCTQCGKHFSSAYKLDIHSKPSWQSKGTYQYAEEKPYKCKKCTECFFRVCDLTKHQRRKHAGDDCNQSADNDTRGRAAAKTSRQGKITEKPHRCTECNKGFSRAWDLKRHHRTKHVAGYDCIQSTAKDIAGIGKAKTSQQGKGPCQYVAGKPYKCTECNKGFFRAWDLKRHHRTKHVAGHDCIQSTAKDIAGLGKAKTSQQGKGPYQYVAGKPYKCTECNKGFFRAWDLKRHHRTKHVAGHDCIQSTAKDIAGLGKAKTSQQGKGPYQYVAGKPYKCTECNKGFFRAWDLKRHHRTKHVAGHDCIQSTAKDIAGLGKAKTSQQGKGPYQYVAGKPYKCTECNKCFFRAWELKRHHRRRHVAGDDCIQSKTKELTDLGEAKSSQHKEKLLTREIGNQSTNRCRPETLQQSNRTCTTEKPHKCKQCYKGFPSRSKLKRHEMIHQKRMPFKCKYCDRGFKALVNCTKHEQTLHQGGKSSEDCSQLRSQRAQRGTPCTTELHSDGSQAVKYFCHPSSVLDEKSSEAECWICLEEFSSHALLLQHIDNHMESI